jgi:hypothetical protein
MAELHTFLVQFPQFSIDDVLEDTHQTAHLFDRPPPVLSGKGVKGEVLDPELNTRLDQTPEILGPCPVASQARQTARNGPSTIPIHNDGDMTCYSS